MLFMCIRFKVKEPKEEASTLQFEQSDLLKRLPEQFFASLVKKAQDLKDHGCDVINLGQGNPDQPTPSHIVKSLQKAAEKPENHKYSPFRGEPKLKEAVATFYQREYGVELDPETEVAVLFGAKAGLVEISQCLLNEGDTALLPDPGYPDYLSGIAMANASPYFMSLLEENSFLPDYSQIDPTILDAAKIIILKLSQ